MLNTFQTASKETHFLAAISHVGNKNRLDARQEDIWKLFFKVIMTPKKHQQASLMS